MFLACFEFTTELGTYHKILNIHLYALDLHLWKDRCTSNQDFFVSWGGGGVGSGVGGGVTGFWCILVTNWRRRSITILFRILVRFFFSSKWAEFLHVVYDLIENHSTVFFSSVCVSFSSKKLCKKPGGSFWDLLLKPFVFSDNDNAHPQSNWKVNFQHTALRVHAWHLFSTLRYFDLFLLI